MRKTLQQTMRMGQPDWALFVWMVGISVAHGARFFVLDDPLNRQVVAAGGIAIYALVAILVALGMRLGYWLAVAFPVVGLTLVLATGGRVDNWQLAVGITQFSAVVYAVFVLLRPRGSR